MLLEPNTILWVLIAYTEILKQGMHLPGMGVCWKNHNPGTAKHMLNVWGINSA